MLIVAINDQRKYGQLPLQVLPLQLQVHLNLQLQPCQMLVAHPLLTYEQHDAVKERKGSGGWAVDGGAHSHAVLRERAHK